MKVSNKSLKGAEIIETEYNYEISFPVADYWKTRKLSKQLAELKGWKDARDVYANLKDAVVYL